MTVPFLVLRGAPGVGKSTVAELLRRAFPGGLTIETDSLRAMVHGNPWGSRAHHGHAVEAAVTLALHYQAAGYCPVILVDTLSGGSEAAASRLGEFVMFTLTASEAALAGRLAGRVGHGFKDAVVSGAINRELAGGSADGDVLVDTTGMTAAAVAELILARSGATPIE